ncbi:bile acid:sodium symporter family protein [Henriciella litoralis]|uniref:bile acid:sodium symporter family protein n=1 Tax=Henriciella litoralis TaxID=568102 RepID=UPI0009FDA44F|nr:bile acid:sodium symporter family protein [Henriciella litoralis]
MAIISDFILPGALALIMLGMGLSLKTEDFVRFISRPAPVLGGLISLLLLLPGIAYVIAYLFGMPPVLAVGLVLVGACPGGTFSNLLTYYARGNLALSVSLTALASFFVIFTMPVIVEFALSRFLGEARTIVLPVGETMLRIMLLTILPVVIGMGISRIRPRLAQRFADPVKNFAGVLIVAVFVSIIVSERETFFAALKVTAVPVILLNLVSVLLGTVIGFVARARAPERRAVTLEHAIKQEGLGIFIALTLLNTPEMVLPLMLNSLVGLFVGSTIVGFARFQGSEPSNESST